MEVENNVHTHSMIQHLAIGMPMHFLMFLKLIMQLRTEFAVKKTIKSEKDDKKNKESLESVSQNKQNEVHPTLYEIRKC